MSKLTIRKKDSEGNRLIVSLEVYRPILEYYHDANIAILYSNIRFWCLRNEDKQKETHFHDGKWWTYNSCRAFSEQFPFWTTQQIRRMLDKLTKDKFLIRGNFNKFKQDRTSWYSINEAVFT